MSRRQHGTSKDGAEPTGGEHSSAEASGPDTAAHRATGGEAPADGELEQLDGDARRRHPRRRRPAPARACSACTAPATPPASAACACPATRPPPPSAPTAAGSTRSPTSWHRARPARRSPAAAVQQVTDRPRRDHLLRPPRAACSSSAAPSATTTGAAVRAVLVGLRGRLRHRRSSSGCTSSTTCTSMTYRRRIRLEVAVDVEDPHVPSVVDGLPDGRLAGARDLGHVRHRLRRPPRADPHPHARRLGRPPPAQGLPARRDPGGVQGRGDPAARRAAGLLDDHHLPNAAASRDHRGPGLHRHRRRLGHPRRRGSTTSASSSTWARSTRPRTACCGWCWSSRARRSPRPASVIGYLHTGIEKNCEYRTWTQGVTFVTRMDYLSPLFNETGYCLGRREAARHRGAAAGPADPRAAHGDQPDRLAPGGAGHRRHGARRAHRHDQRLPRARGPAAPARARSPACG